MEKNQLNFNAPLLSTRKSTSLSSSDRQQKNPINMKPPPTKTTDFELQEVTKTGNVPFVWEQIPGTPKNEAIKKLQIPLNTPRLPPGRRNNSCRFELHPVFKDHSALIEILHESVYRNRESEDTESLDDVYSDAAETFESMSLYGLSDSQVTNTNQPGKFKLDEQTGEFMMNRFLPAAKAAILDTPKYVSKKRAEPIKQDKAAILDTPKYVTKKRVEPIKQDKARKSSNHQYYANVVLSNYRYVEDVKSEENGPDKRAKRLMKSSGFLPHLCVKNSLCIVNNMGVVKSNNATKYATNDITRLTRKAYSGPIDKNCKDQNETKRRNSGLVRVDPKTNQSTRFSYSSSPCNTEGGGLSPFMASRKPYITTLRGMDTIGRVNMEQGVVQEGKLDIIDGKTEDKKEHSEGNLGNPLFPPLPKSPADSWLYQRVSNVNLRSPGLRLNQDIGFYAEKPVQKLHCSSTKWETIVKTSHSHRFNRNFSEVKPLCDPLSVPQ